MQKGRFHSETDMEKQQYIIFISSFDVLSRRKMSSIYKGLGEIKDRGGYFGCSYWILGDVLTYEISGSFPLQHEDLRIANLKTALNNPGNNPTFFYTEKEIKDGMQSQENNFPTLQTRYLLLQSDSRDLVKRMGNILFHQGMQYGIVDAFQRDKKDYIRWKGDNVTGKSGQRWGGPVREDEEK